MQSNNDNYLYHHHLLLLHHIVICLQTTPTVYKQGTILKLFVQLNIELKTK